jgi:signal transduction histidine kinase/CheY-like chemotaxis protein
MSDRRLRLCTRLRMPSELLPPARTSDDETRVIVVPPTEADGVAIAKVFAASGIACLICRHAAHLGEVLQAGAGALVIAEEALLADSRVLLQRIADEPVWSDLPIVVLARAGRESAALGTLLPGFGNVTVVERPLRTLSLVSIVHSGLRARARQYQVRDYLIERDQLLDSERSARSEAERAGRTKDEFLATLSHELRTPLNAILGWTHVLLQQRALPTEIHNTLLIIERNARSQAQIIADLLDMSSITSGKLRLDVQPLDLSSVINATLETIKPAATAKELRLQVALDPKAGSIRGDPNRLQQVLWNLLINAVKFTPQGGHISVSLACLQSHVELDISDSGDGIDAAFLPHIFDRFRQADSSSARQHGGLGLGLSIVKQLVELHGGNIAVESAGRGKGATFRVRLPRLAASSDFAAAEPALRDTSAIERPSPRDALEGVRILVVDDEPDARTLIQRLLQDHHASVLMASSTDEALRILHSEPLDVLVSDIGMPGEDGYALIRRLRALDHPNGRIPAIALTAYARVEDRVKAIDTGYQSHLSKPVEPAELTAMVKRLADGRLRTT